jgi:transmembrane sensor
VAATGVGEFQKLALPDGSVVDLNTDSKVDVTFTPSERRVQLAHGEAHFSVAKDPARLFVVEAHGVAVVAVGTAFAVRLRSESVEVLVCEGRVRVNDVRRRVSLLSVPAVQTNDAAEPPLLSASI